MRLLAGLLLALVGCGGPAAEAVVVCFGDSTTLWRGPELNWTELLEADLRQAGWKIRVVNSGMSSDDTDGGRLRFLAEVLGHAPRVVTIDFGINDAMVDLDKGRTAPRVPLERYEANLRYFVRRLRELGAEPILLTPNPLRWAPWLRERFGGPPYDPDDPRGMNAVLDAYVAAVRRIAVEQDVPLVDLNRSFEAEEIPVEELLLDGIHPNDAGHRLVAREVAPVVDEALRSRSPVASGA